MGEFPAMNPMMLLFIAQMWCAIYQPVAQSAFNRADCLGQLSDAVVHREQAGGFDDHGVG